MEHIGNLWRCKESEMPWKQDVMERHGFESRRAHHLVPSLCDRLEKGIAGEGFWPTSTRFQRERRVDLNAETHWPGEEIRPNRARSLAQELHIQMRGGLRRTPTQPSALASRVAAA